MEEVTGTEGYILQPEYTEDEMEQREERENGVEVENNADEEFEVVEDRLGNTSWCQCENCVEMATVKECLCCTEENASLVEKIHEEYIECITEHSDFAQICLNPRVLQVIMHCLREIRGYGQQVDWENRAYRLVAYRAYTFWIHSFLGKKRRRVIPSCAVKAIRNKFPSSDGQYTGFLEVEEAFDL